MPRSVRRRAVRTEVEVLDRETFAALKAHLPEWLAAYLLHHKHPQRGTADARLLELLTFDPETAPLPGLLYRSPLATVWKAHRPALLARWSAEGNKGDPWGVYLDRDPYDPDPRRLLRAVA